MTFVRFRSSAVLVLTILLATCSSAKAQQPTKVIPIGYLTGESLSANAARTESFRQGLRELGYVEGKNIVIEWRYAEGKLDRLPALAAELVRLKVNVIVTGAPAATRAAKAATSTIPTVIQPGATWREHHRTVHLCAGARRYTAEDSERGRP